MLDIIRRNAASWLMKFILGAIVVVFIFWGVGTFRSQRLDIMAKVNGQKILVEDYQKAYNSTLDRLRRMYKGAISEAMLKQMHLKQQVLDQLIDTALVEQEAKKMGIRVTDKEIQKVILSIPAFKQNGSFDNRLYQMALRNAGLKPVDFEQNVRHEMYLRKVQALLTSGVAVPDAEAAMHYIYENAEINVEFVKIKGDDCLSSVNATDEKLRTWFKSHQEKFRTDPQIKLKYVLFSREELKKSVNATDAEIRQYYQDHPDEFRLPEMRRASHILLKIPNDASKAELEAIRKKAEEIEKRLKKGEAFASLAKEYSEDPVSAARGGDLGLFKKGTMVKPFDDKVFSMKEGEISEPIQTNFGLHIIKVTDIRPSRELTLKEVHDRIASQIKAKKTEKMLWDQANKAYDTIIELGSLEAYADSANKTIKETGFFSRKQPSPVLGFNPQVTGAIFSLGKGELSSLMEVPKGVLIAEVADKKAPYIPPFNEVKDKVTTAYRHDRALELCREKAEDFLKAAKEKGFVKAAALYGLKIEETGYFKRLDASGNNRTKLPPTVVKDALSLDKSRPLPDKISTDNQTFYVLYLKGDRDTADMKAFDSKKKAEIKKKVRQVKSETVFQDWLKHIRDKAKIEMIRKP